MAAPSRSIDVDLTRGVLQELLAHEAFRVHFYQAVRLLTRGQAGRAAVGGFVNPATEVVRFSAYASTAFPASEIQDLAWRDDKPPLMTVNFMGLTGPEGVLPLVYTELLLERGRNKDHALREMLDIFNHRMISLLYQGWEKHKFAVRHERDGADSVTACLKSFLGLASPGLAARQDITDGSLVYYAGLLVQRPHSAVALQQLIADYFEVPVEVQQFCGTWHRLDRGTQTCLDDRPVPSACLGGGALVGDEVWDLHAGVRVRLGPLDLPQYLEFLPGNPGHRTLSSMVRFYANDEFQFEAQLVLKREQAPACELGNETLNGPRLGWLSWAHTAAMDRDPSETLIRL